MSGLACRPPVLVALMRAHALLSVGALVAALAACTTEQLPPDAALTISPEEQTYTVPDRRDENGACLIDPSRYVDLPLVFALRDGQGSPIGEAELTVYVDFGDNTFGGYPVLELYEDFNGNGVVDPESELVSGAGDEIATIRTDKYGGDAVLLLRMNLSCGYRGSAIGFVDGVSARASFEVLPEEDGLGDDEVDDVSDGEEGEEP